MTLSRGVASPNLSSVTIPASPPVSAFDLMSKKGIGNVNLDDIARHADYDFRDYEDYFLTVGGRVDVQNRSYMSYNLQYLDLHEGLNSRDSEQGFEPTRYTVYGANLGYDHETHTFTELLPPGESVPNLAIDWIFKIPPELLAERRLPPGGLTVYSGGLKLTNADSGELLTYIPIKIGRGIAVSSGSKRNASPVQASTVSHH